MGVLIIDEHEVRELLDMASCIAAMERVLAELARGEVLNPLRTVMRTPDQRFFGLMPSWRGGEQPVFALKEIVVSPDNPRAGLDPHQGAVLLHDGRTGVLQAIVAASPITEIRTAAVSAVATKLLAAGVPRRVAILGSGIQGHAHARAMRTIAPDCELRVWSRNQEHAHRLAAEHGAEPAASARDAVLGADVVCTCTAAREPVLERAWLAAGAHVNAVGSSIPSARELDTETVAAAALFVDRRESALNEAGDYLIAAAEAGLGPEHIRAELGELLIGSHGGRAGGDELTLFKSLGIGAEDLAAAELCVARARERGVGSELDF